MVFVFDFFFVSCSSVNDNDDLIPLLNSYTELLKATYGSFYVAELIEAQNEKNKCLTAEVNTNLKSRAFDVLIAKRF